MVSRETTVHIVSVALAVLVFVLLEGLNAGTEDVDVSIVALLLVYGLVFGGSHLYLALRGDDGMVPVTARWRYLTMIGVLLGTGAVSLEYGTRAIGPTDGNTIALVVAVLTILAYLASENVSAYRSAVGE